MSGYAVIRASDYLRRDDEQPPAYVMRIDKETDASLMGDILGEDGQPTNWRSAFDTQPTTKRSGYGPSAKWETTRAGRVRKGRLLSRHLSFDEAWAALGLASTAWFGAENREAERAASAAFSEATKRLEEEKARLKAEMQRRLKGLQDAEAEARMAMHRARAAMYAKQSAAAIETAKSVPTPASSTPSFSEVG